MSDISFDIAISDHNMTKETLEDFGEVVGAVHSQCNDSELCFWTFIRYVSIRHPSILGIGLNPEVALKCNELISQVSLPYIHVAVVIYDSPFDSNQTSYREPWWKFWYRSPEK